MPAARNDPGANPIATRGAPRLQNGGGAAAGGRSALRTIRTWGEMIKFSHSVFALPFALMATFLAGRETPRGTVAWGQVTLIVVCMIGARSFAMTFNRIVDAAIDARNPRTAGRAIPAGRIGARQAWGFAAGGAAVFLAGCAGFAWAFGNTWPALLAAPVLALLAVYSYCKRFTRLSHFVLGTVIALAPAAAWIAISPETIGWAAATMTAAVALWIGGFDIIYACQDVEVDRRQGLHSIPAFVGVTAALWIARACHAATVALLVLLGFVAGLGWVYAAGVGVTAVMLLAEHAVVRADDLSRVNLAFFWLNGCISLVLGAAGIVDVAIR